MLPIKKNSLFWNWYNVYRKLANPYTQAVGTEYLFPILKKEFQYCRKLQMHLALAVLKIPALPLTGLNHSMESNVLLKNIVSVIKSNLRATDMIFYNGIQDFALLFPKAKKITAHRLLARIKTGLKHIYAYDNPLNIEAGYAGFPADSSSFIELEECANKALNLAVQAKGNKVIGYFREKRAAVRVPLQIEVRYAVSGIDDHIVCSRNISKKGIMVSGISDLPQSDNVMLRFKLPNHSSSEIIVSAKTVWNKLYQKTDKMDIGLCFTSLTNPAKQKLAEYISHTAPSIVRF